MSWSFLCLFGGVEERMEVFSVGVVRRRRRRSKEGLVVGDGGIFVRC